MSPAKPMPDRRGAWGHYWQEVQAGRLVFQRCGACGHRFFFARLLCPRCASERVDWFESAGRGAVYSFTIVRRHPHPGFQAEAPFAVALADMEDLDPGSRMLARVVGCEPGDVHIGMPVVVTFAPLSGDFTLPVFTPAAAGGATGRTGGVR